MASEVDEQAVRVTEFQQRVQGIHDSLARGLLVQEESDIAVTVVLSQDVRDSPGITGRTTQAVPVLVLIDTDNQGMTAPRVIVRHPGTGGGSDLEATGGFGSECDDNRQEDSNEYTSLHPGQTSDSEGTEQWRSWAEGD